MQFDGNDSISESNRNRQDKITAALNLPIVATYNVRSLFPKIGNFKTDKLLERNISVSFVSEIWERSDKKEPNSKGVSYGGAALIVNL
jgi:hypothetical protein